MPGLTRHPDKLDVKQSLWIPGFLLDNQNFITKVSLPIKRAASAASGKAEP